MGERHEFETKGQDEFSRVTHRVVLEDPDGDTVVVLRVRLEGFAKPSWSCPKCGENDGNEFSAGMFSTIRYQCEHLVSAKAQACKLMLLESLGSGDAG